MIFSRILCPTDFSQYSEQAIDLAAKTRRVGEIILLHVVPSRGNGQEIKEAVRAAGIRIGAIRDALAAKGIRSKATVKTGDPAGEITKNAEKEDVSAIWMSAYGKGCLHDFLLGSVVNEVTVKTKRPVIVIRSLHQE